MLGISHNTYRTMASGLRVAGNRIPGLVSKGTNRSLAVVPSRKELESIDLRIAKVQQLSPNIAYKGVPLNAPWTWPINRIILQPTPSYIRLPKTSAVNLFFGGLPALMAAVKKKTNEPDSLITYINDGKLAKSTQSGHQAHNHPSEFVAEDCSTKNLIKTMAQGLGILPLPDPTDLKRYSYLHFPRIWKQMRLDPIENLKLYAGFFKQRIKHDLTSINGVSEQDRWLCRTIKNSLDFHEKLSAKIEAKTGLKTLKREFRIYWSQDHAGIAKKAADWKELGIECEMMKSDELLKRTLLRPDKGLAVLKILGDGQFEPETPKRIIDYFTGEYPSTFMMHFGEVQMIYLNPKSKKPEAVQIRGLDGHSTTIRVNSVFGTPGHDRVFEYDSSGTSKQLWKSVPVSGVSSLWQCTLSRKELESRWNISANDEKALKKHLDGLCASANLCNLHVTVFNNTIGTENVKLYVRVSQGANFNSDLADKNDLINIATNLDKFFIGQWDLISAGTCTRQTGVTNVPTITEMFGYDYSGVGYSASVPPDEDDPKPAL